MAKRTVRLNLDDAWREKIRLSVIIDRIAKCANGELQMTAQELKAAEIILRKTVPDLARTELTNAPGETFKTESVNETDQQIIDRYLASSKKTDYSKTIN